MKINYLWRICSRITVMLLIAISFSGCWDARELSNMAIVAAVGVDLADQPGKVIVTVQIIKPGEVKSGGGGDDGGGQSKGSGKQAYLVMSSAGKTVAEAFQNFAFRLNRELYLPDNQIIIFGKDAAKQGVRPLIDYFVRARETRETAWISVANGKAGDILESRTELEKISAVEMTRLIGNRTFTSQVSGIMQNDFVNLLMSKTAAPYATFIDVVGEQKDVQLLGTAVFKKDKLAGHLDRPETRGFLWITGKIGRGLIPIRLPGGGEVSCGILKSQSKISPGWSAGLPQIDLEIKGQFSILDNPTAEDLSKMEKTQRLEQLLKQAIRREINRALAKARQLDSDLFGFGEAFHLKYPKQWKMLQPDWDRYFPGIPVRLRFKIQITEIGLNFKPVTPQ